MKTSIETSQYEQQAIDFMIKTGTKIKMTYLKHDYHFQNDLHTRDIYRVTLSRNGQKMTIRFGQSLKEVGQEPTEYDVLTCLTKNDPEHFEGFCSDFGYDTDSVKALTIYKAVCKEWVGVNRVFGDVLEQLQEIQ